MVVKVPWEEVKGIMGKRPSSHSASSMVPAARGAQVGGFKCHGHDQVSSACEVCLILSCLHQRARARTM